MLLYKFITIFIAYSTIVRSFNFRGVQLNATDQRVRATASYTFFLDRTVDSASASTPWDTTLVSSSANITLAFPITYVGVSSYRCQNLSIDDQLIRTFSCSKIGNKIVVRNFMTSGAYIKKVVLIIGSVVNPSVGGKTPDFQGSIGDDIAYPTDWSSIYLIANSFLQCSAIFNSVEGNTTGQLTVSTLSLNALPVQGYYIITFPNLWTRDAASQIIRFSQNQPCTLVYPSSTTGAICTGGNNSTGYPMITIEYAGGDFALTIKLLRVRAPPTNEPIDYIKIQSFYGTDQPVDQCSVNPTGIIERSITNIVTATLETPYPSTSIGLSLTFFLVDTLTSADTIYFDFASTYSPTFTYANITSPYPTTLFSTDTSILNFTINRTLGATQSLTFRFYSITTPPSIAAVDKFTVGVELHGYPKMKGYFGFDVQVAHIQNITLAPDLLRVGALTTYRLGFTLPIPIRSTGAVRVYFPDILQITSSIRAFCQGVQLNLQVINNTKGVQLTGFSIPPTNPVSISFANMPNLLTTSPTTIPIQIKTYRSFTLMDEVCFGQSSSVLQLTASQTLGCQVESSSRVTGEVGVNITFTITNSFPIQYNSTVQIVYNQISTSSNPNDMACLVNGLVENCTANGSVIVVQLNNTSVRSNSGLVVVIGFFFTNPPITKPISYFSVATFTPALYLLQYMTAPVYLTNVDQPSALRYFVLYSRTSSVNSALSTYTFVVSLLQPLLAGTNTIVLIFPSSLSLQQSSCDDCTITMPSTITFSISSGFNILIITNIQNAVSTQPINSISAAIYFDSYKYAETTHLGNSIINTQTSALNILGANYSSYYYGATASITVRLGALVTSIRQLWIAFPKQYQIGSVDCTLTGATIESSSIINSSLTINVTNFTSSNVVITLTNVVLPQLNQSLPIVMKTFTTGGYGVSTGQLPLWHPICTLPCYTCTSVTTQCLSCYTDISITTLSIYNPTAFSCVDQCQQTQINIQQTCNTCSPTCLTCSLSINNCTSCGTGAYLYDHQCLPNCPTTHYRVVVGRYCEQCQRPCQTCISDQQCLTCLTGWFYYQGVCELTCPSEVTIKDTVNRACIPCSSLCLTCSMTSTNCTSCNQGLAMQNGVCVSTCSNNMYILNSACVTTCSAPCSTCLVYATYCLTCPPSYHLYNNSCTTECPTMYYIHTDGSCQPCASLPIHCKYCTSSSNCYICDVGFVLFEGLCLTYTPTGYANISGVATLCHDSCVTCDTLITNCTSCKYDYYHNGQCVTSCPDSHFKFNHTCTRCLPPCNNCLNETTCLSCLPSSNRFWVADTMSCQLTCPSMFYPNSSIFVCLRCGYPCATCSSKTVCATCVSSTYFYNNRCLTICPDGYYQNTSTNACTLCSFPCSSCILDSASTCTSCASNYFYLYPNQCVLNCVPPYINNYEYKVCVNCTDPCLSCSQTACAKCKNTHILYQSACVLSCPSSQYAQAILDGTRECAACPTQCQSCTNATYCTACALGYYWEMGPISGICVQMCPPHRPILEQTGCEPCQDENCTACYSNNQCYQCRNTSILYQGFCLNECPQGYVYNVSLNSCSLAPPEQKNETAPVIQPNSSVMITLPFKMIFCIAGGGLSLFFLFLVWCAEISLWPMLVCAWSVAEVGALTVTTYAYHRYYVYIFTPIKAYGFVMSGALIWITSINLFVFYYSACKVLLPDAKYRRWKKSASCWQILILSLVQIITLLNYKFQHFTWCGIKIAPKLQSVSKLKYLSVASALGLVPSIAYIIILILLLNEVKQLFLLWLDALIVLALAAILSGLALKRSDKFFEEQYEDMVLHRRHISSDEFLSSPMKGTQREQTYIQTPLDPRQKSQISYIDTSSEMSSRMELKSSSRPFLLSSSHHQSLNQTVNQLLNQQQNQQVNQLVSQSLSNSSGLVSSAGRASRREVSLQCSILQLPSSFDSKTSQYQVECEYESGSKFGVMGSMQQQKAWDGVVHQPQYYQQEYDLNDAVILDNDGKLVEMWDIESNQAVLQQQVYSSNPHSARQDAPQNGTAGSLLQMLDEVEIVQVLQNQNSPTITIPPQSTISIPQQSITVPQQSTITVPEQLTISNHQEQERQDNHTNMSVNPIVIEWGGSRTDENTYIHKYTSILRQRLQPEEVSTPNNSPHIPILTHQTSMGIEREDNNLYNSPDQSRVNIMLNTSNNMSLSYLQPINIPNPDPNPNPPQQQGQQVQPEEENEGDRFDNSLLSNHGGSLSSSQTSQYQASELSNHNGSVSSDDTPQQQEQEEGEKKQEGQHVEEISERENRKYTAMEDELNSNMELEDQGRWQFLLQIQEQHILHTDMNQNQNNMRDEIMEDQINNTIKSQNNGNNGVIQNESKGQHYQIDRNLKLNESENKEENIKVDTQFQLTNSLQQIEQQSDGNSILEGELLTGSSKQTDTLRNTNKSSKSLKKQQSKQAQLPSDRRPNILNLEEHEEVDSQSQEEYLGSKMEKNWPKPDDSNKFSIKTKRKKKQEPNHKVIVVESRKFKKLKRQASELEKQIQEGKRLKTLLQGQDMNVDKKDKKERRKRSVKKQSKEEELKSIYLNKNQLRESKKL